MDYVFALPHLNALLNSASSVLLVAGYVQMRRRNLHAHRACMISAFTISGIFLASYVTYHSLLLYYFHRGPTKFQGTGLIRPLYFTVLISHTLLAVLIGPLAIITLVRAVRGDFSKHRRVARWTFPLWLYVSVTGVLVYLMLYWLYPARSEAL